MSFFEDKEYENLDWLNAAIGSYVFSLNDKVSLLDDRYPITFDMLKDHANYGLDKAVIFKQMASEKDIKFNELELRSIRQLFKFEFDDDFATIDFDKEELNVPIFFVKAAPAFNEKQIVDTVCAMVQTKFKNIRKEYTNLTNFNEVMEILGCEERLKSTSFKKKSPALRRHIIAIIKEDTWQIRNMDLFINLIDWIKLYCEQGDLSAISNIAKLKCMTHSKNPIYSMKEIV